jgi:uncharacterized protein with PQ loop repeat
MNKLDTQFEQLMKGISIDSPSKDFSLKVMARVQAEAAVKKHSLLENYQPVISRKVWIILIVAFIILLIYISVSSQPTAPVKEPGLLSVISDSVQKLNTTGVSNVWQKASGLFTSIPLIAYVILTASLALWTLDSFLTRFRHTTAEIRIN